MLFSTSGKGGSSEPARGGARYKMTQTGFEEVAKLSDLPDNLPVEVRRASGERVCLIQEHGVVSAIGSLCTHQEFEMAHGNVPGDGTIECAFHGARFDLRTGAVLEGPATDPLPVYDVVVREGAVLLGPRKAA